MWSVLIAASLRQRLLVLVLTAGLVAAGVWAWLGLPIDAFPDVSSTQVKVILKAPGMTPEEVESRITVPLEQELLGLPKQKVLRTTSKYAIADLTLDFEDGTDVYWARQQVSERLAGVLAELPPGTSGGLAPITTPLGEVFMFTLEGPQSLAEKRRVLDWLIRPALRTVPGVADVNVLGGRAETFEVVPDAAALQARGLTLQQLEHALQAGNRNDGAGRLNVGEEALIVRAEGAVRTLDDVAQTVVRSGPAGLASGEARPHGDAYAGVVRVADVAQVRRGELTRYGAVVRDGRGETAQGLVLGLRGANARQVVQAVRAKLAELRLPEGLTVEVFYDRSSLVNRAVGTVGKALGEAVVLVLVLLMAFLGQVRPAVVVALMLPLAALSTFVLMRLMGVSANLMSLGGLAIAIGMLVDGAVVVVENIEAALADPARRQQGLLTRVREASREVAAPVASGIAIIVIVFLPLLTLEGLEGKLFGPVALTIVAALSASLLLSLTVVPVVASLLLKPGPEHQTWLMRQAQALYARLLPWALGHGRVVMGGALAAGAMGLLLLAVVGKSFMPTLDEGDVVMQLEGLPSINVDAAVANDLRVQQALLQRVPEVRHVVSRAGADELGLDPMGLNQTDAYLVLKPRAEWRQPDREWLTEQLRAVMADFPGIEVNYTQPIDSRVAEMLTGARGDLAIKVYGPDLNELARLARAIEGTVSRIAGATDAFTLRNDGVQYLQVQVDRLAAGRVGLNAEAIQADLRRWVEGQPVGVVHEAGRRVPLVIRGDDALRRSDADFEDLRITTPGGGSVPLRQVARLARVDGPVKVDREMAQRFAVVQANVTGRDLVGFVDEARIRVAQEVPLPAGYTLSWGGQFENQQRAAQRLLLVVPVALGLIALILYTAFGSLRQTALVLANVPLALVGGVAGLVVAGEYLSVPASVGFIALLGIAVLNGVVLVSHFNDLQARGLPMAQVVLEGAQRRLRPVLMTAAITAGGLLPLLFASGPGSEIQKPLAVVVTGGLLSATALTLLLLPVLYARWGAQPTRAEEAPAA